MSVGAVSDKGKGQRGKEVLVLWAIPTNPCLVAWLNPKHLGLFPALADFSAGSSLPLIFICLCKGFLSRILPTCSCVLVLLM